MIQRSSLESLYICFSFAYHDFNAYCIVKKKQITKNHHSIWWLVENIIFALNTRKKIKHTNVFSSYRHTQMNLHNCSNSIYHYYYGHYDYETEKKELNTHTQYLSAIECVERVRKEFLLFFSSSPSPTRDFMNRIPYKSKFWSLSFRIMRNEWKKSLKIFESLKAEKMIFSFSLKYKQYVP